MKIDQDVLCDFCKEFNNANRDSCEGCFCGDIKEQYLESIGIIDDEIPAKTFKNLSIGDTIYIIDNNGQLPVIKNKIVTKLSQKIKELYVEADGISSFIQLDKLSNNRQKNIFLNEKDCKDEVIKICMNRILDISKLIGSLS